MYLEYRSLDLPRGHNSQLVSSLGTDVNVPAGHDEQELASTNVYTVAKSPTAKVWVLDVNVVLASHTFAPPTFDSSETLN